MDYYDEVETGEEFKTDIKIHTPVNHSGPQEIHFLNLDNFGLDFGVKEELRTESESTEENPSDPLQSFGAESKFTYCAQCKETFEFFTKKVNLCPKCKSVLAYKCGTCEKIFTSRSSLPRHLKVCGVRKDTIEKFYCSYCDYIAHQRSDIVDHTRRKHLPQDSRSTKCPKCGKTCSTRPVMREHLKRCGASEKFKRSRKTIGQNKCPNCDKNYSSRPCLQKHLKICGSADLEYFYCDYCDYKSPRKNDLRCHIEAKHLPRDPNLNKCKNCKKIFTRLSYLKVHLKLCSQSDDVKRSMLRFTCDYCQHKTFGKQQIFHHIKTHHLPRNFITYYCKNCGKAYNNSSSLRYHLKSCGQINPFQNMKYYFCDHCDYKTFRKCQLGKHIQSSHFKEKFNCDSCKKTYSSLYDLNDHIRRVHKVLAASEYFYCDHCEYRNSQKPSLVHHIQSNHMSVSFKCKTCTKSFKSQYRLYGHAKFSCKNSSTLRRLTCDYCQYQTGSKSYIRNHIQSKHMSDTFQCPKCEKSFSSEVTLRLHTLHSCKNSSTLRRLTCDICKFETSYKKNLVSHMQSKHMGVSYKCKACRKRLKTKPGFNKHVKYFCKYSSNLKSFSCDHCQYKASVKYDLKKHIQSLHLNSNFKCKICRKSYSSQNGLKRHRCKNKNKNL